MTELEILTFIRDTYGSILTSAALDNRVFDLAAAVKNGGKT